MLRHLLLIPIAATTAACTGDAKAPTAVAPAASLTEELRIDGHEHDFVPFGNESGGSIAVAEDGTIAISQMQDHVVRFFSASGEPLGEFGGEGSGPGEFESPTRIGWVRDSLWIYDPGLRRVTFLTPGREFARTVAVSRPPTPAPTLEERLPPAVASFPIAIHAGGWRTELVMPLREGSSPLAVGSEVYFGRLSEAAELESIVAWIPTGETAVYSAGGSAGLPLSNRTVFDAARDGSRSGFARAEIDGERATMGVHLFGSAGDTIYSRRIPIELVPLPQAVRDSVYDRWIARLPSSLGEAVRARADEVTYYPPLQAMIIGRDGTVWVALAKQNGLRPHVVLDARGELVGKLVLADRNRISEAEHDRIWVIEKDEFDVESLVRYGVKW